MPKKLAIAVLLMCGMAVPQTSLDTSLDKLTKALDYHMRIETDLLEMTVQLHQLNDPHVEDIIQAHMLKIKAWNDAAIAVTKKRK